MWLSICGHMKHRYAMQGPVCVYGWILRCSSNGCDAMHLRALVCYLLIDLTV
jgi:hypothetical protein